MTPPGRRRAADLTVIAESIVSTVRTSGGALPQSDLRLALSRGPLLHRSPSTIDRYILRAVALRSEAIRLRRRRARRGPPRNIVEAR